MQEKPTILYKLGGYYLMPHELLHVLAYWMLGKPCYYKWGDYCVKPLEKMRRNERLFTSLFPFMVCFGGGLFFHLLWVLSAFFITSSPERYFAEPTWHIIFLVVGILLIFYSSTAHGDLINSYHLLFTHQQTQNNRPEPHRSSDDYTQRRKHP